MRWDDLFADLGAQWDAAARRELDGEVADRTRRERALVGLPERLSAAGEGRVALTVHVAGTLADALQARGWQLAGGAR